MSNPINSPVVDCERSQSWKVSCEICAAVHIAGDEGTESEIRVEVGPFSKTSGRVDAV